MLSFSVGCRAPASIRRGGRVLLATVVLAASVAGGAYVAAPAGALPPLTLTPTSTSLVAPSSSGALNGLSVSGDPTSPLQVTVATTLGTLTIATTTGLTLGYGNSWSGTASVTFTGLQSAINAGLASTTLVTSSTTGTATVGLTAMVAQGGYDYLASNQHFYQYVACAGCSWTSAIAGAKALNFAGQPGYLASIPNATVNTFISTKIANATNVWFGARAYESIATDGTQTLATVNGTTYARVWRWTAGSDESPIAGGVISECTNNAGACSFANSGSFYSAWGSGEPNNAGGSSPAYRGEWAAVTNWGGSSGAWNDLPPTNGGASGYVVEYGGKPNADAQLGTGFAGVVTTASNVQVAAAAVVPSAPSITATAADSAATLSWSPPGDGGSTITGYQVSTDGGTVWNTIATTSSTATVNGNVVTTVHATAAGLTNGTSYNISVRATNSVGNGVASNAVATTPVAVADPPTAVVATRANGSAGVSWTAPGSNGGSAITGYVVTASPGGSTCSTTGATSCTVIGLANGTPYTFTVHATNVAGNSAESSPSAAVTPATAPNSPTAVSAVRGNGSAAVTFTPPVGNGGAAITGYTATASPGGATASCSSSPCAVTGLTNGTAYSFTVHATNAVGNSAESSASAAVTPATVPDAPTAVVATQENGYAGISWTGSASNGGSAITGYFVTASPGGSACSTMGATACTVIGLANGTAYTFSVHATNALGNSTESSASAAVTPATVPDPPAGVSAVRGNASATVSWTAPAGNGGAALTGYEVTVSPGGATVSCGTSPCIVSGLTNGTAYAFSVHATNVVGNSAESSLSAAVTPATVPDAPTNPVATRGAGSADVVFTAPAGNGGSAVTDYTVTASPGGQTCSTSGATSCTVNGLTNGTPYTFTVHATNVVGNSAESSPSAAVTPVTVPGAPSIVSVNPANGSAIVTWTAPSSNGGSAVTGYTVTASPGGLTCFTSGTTSCTVTGLTNGAAYTFTVHATNAVGNGAESTVSASFTPTTVPDPPTGVSVIRGNGSARVSWTAPANTGGAAVSGYTVIASPGGQTCATSGATTCIVPGLANGSAYTFSVYATNPVGSSTASSVSAPVTPATVPDPPTDVAGTRGNGFVLVHWVAPVNVGGDTIVGYIVTVLPGGGATPCATSPCALAGLANGSAYTFSVHATNSVGDSLESVASNAVTPATVPDPPTDVRVTGGNGSATITFTAPLNTGGAAVSSFRVTASPSGKTCAAAAGARSCTVTGLANGTAYSFTVHATNAVGDSVGSSVSDSVTPIGPPDPSEPAESEVPTGGSTAATPGGAGYWVLDPAGVLSNHGDAVDYGSQTGTYGTDSVVAINSTTTGDGYWLVRADGAVFTFGDARFYGSLHGVALNQPIVGIARTPKNNGYWLIGGDGGVFAFGDAQFYGSLSETHLNDAIVGIAVTPSGHGYWLVAADGGVFTFGDARFYGSEGGHHLNGPVVGIAGIPDGRGYWLVAADGGVFTFGAARFHGSLGADGTVPIVGIIADNKTRYRLITREGDARSFQ